MYGAPGGITQRIHALRPVGSLRLFKFAPANLSNLGFSHTAEHGINKKTGTRPVLLFMARPEGFEPPTNWFEANYSIQLSYGRMSLTSESIM